MRLTHLATRDFRNLEGVDLRIEARFVILHGDNAQGKTNTLEAIYLLATLKPLRARRLKELIRWGEGACAVGGAVLHRGLERRYRIDLADGTKRVRLDGAPIGDLGEYFEGIRAIAFTPQDGGIVTEGPKVRRRWIDRAAFTARPVHLDVVRTYRRALDQKSAALRADPVDRSVLDVLDQQVATAGAELAQRRVEMLAELEPFVQRVHREIAGGSGDLRLRYRTSAAGDTAPERRDALLDKLVDSRPDEIRRGYTLCGPQTDEVVLTLEGKKARTYGSQGQVRSIVLALKLGELVAARQRGDAPLFLLDDVSSELDAQRTRRLVGVLHDLDVQVFATTTDPAYLDVLPEAQTLRVRVVDGALATG